MSYENIITAICVIAAATTILISFRFAYWRNRAERAEDDLAEIEASIEVRGGALVADDLRRRVANTLLLAKARASVFEASK